MLIILLLSVLATSDCVEFSSRPTNVTITLLYFTQLETNSATVLAPYGLWSLMAGLSYGAVGDTYWEIFRAFTLLTDLTKFTNEYRKLQKAIFDTTLGVDIKNRNFYFVDTSFKELIERDFTDILIENFETSVKTLDFQDPSAFRIINTYIENIAPPVTNVFSPSDFKSSSIIMGNVFFFKGLWTLPFNVSETRIEDNTLTMYQRAKVPYSHLDSMEASVMELSYGSDGKFCMLIIIPDPNITTRRVYTNFQYVTFRQILAKLENDTAEFGLKVIDIKLPRIAKISNLILNKPINDMGVYSAFEPEHAQFGKMVRQPIFIDTIECSTSLILNEQGTVAFSTIPGLRNLPNINKTEKFPARILFILEKTTATVIFGGIFP